MNYRKESGSRETRTLSPGLLTMIVKIRLKHVSMFFEHFLLLSLPKNVP